MFKKNVLEKLMLLEESQTSMKWSCGMWLVIVMYETILLSSSNHCTTSLNSSLVIEQSGIADVLIPVVSCNVTNFIDMVIYQEDGLCFVPNGVHRFFVNSPLPVYRSLN